MVLPIVGELDEAGRPLAESAPAFSVLGVGSAVARRAFTEVPAAHWDWVQVPESAPLGCGTDGCIENQY